MAYLALHTCPLFLLPRGEGFTHMQSSFVEKQCAAQCVLQLNARTS